MANSQSASWLGQAYKQLGLALGDAEFFKYRADVDKREKEFLSNLPKLRREAGTTLVNYYEKTGAEYKALTLTMSLPQGAIDAKETRPNMLTDKLLDWVTRNKKQDQRNERLAAVALLAPRLKAQKLDWPPPMIDAYQRDARSMAEEILDQALKAPPTERENLLKGAKAWAGALREEPRELLALIASASASAAPQ